MESGTDWRHFLFSKSNNKLESGSVPHQDSYGQGQNMVHSWPVVLL